MKKILNISLLAFYLVFTLGITTSFHYCGGEVVSAKVENPLFSHETEDDCCPQSCQSPCCEEKIVDLKIQDLHSPKYSQTPDSDIFITIDYSIADKILPAREFTSKIQLCTSDPPDNLYISNCSFLI